MVRNMFRNILLSAAQLPFQFVRYFTASGLFEITRKVDSKIELDHEKCV